MVSGDNEKFISTTILNKFWQNNTEKLSKKLFSFPKMLGT